MSEAARPAGLQILGQTIEWPSGPWSATGFITLCLLLGYIAFLSYSFALGASSDRFRQVAEIWSLSYNRDGTEVKSKGVRKVEFWTPSSKTVTADWGPEAAGSWEKLDSEKRVEDFGKFLKSSDLGVVGYRRWEVWGHGFTHFKAGWWWSMTVQKDFDPAEFSKIYRDFWHTPGTVYMEVIATESDHR